MSQVFMLRLDHVSSFLSPRVCLQGSANINPREKVEKPRSRSAAPRHRQQGSREKVMTGLYPFFRDLL